MQPMLVLAWEYLSNNPDGTNKREEVNKVVLKEFIDSCSDGTERLWIYDEHV